MILNAQGRPSQWFASMHIHEEKDGCHGFQLGIASAYSHQLIVRTTIPR